MNDSPSATSQLVEVVVRPTEERLAVKNDNGAMITLTTRVLPVIARMLSLSLVFCLWTTKSFAENKLTSDEKADGWVLLFDGKSTAGWKNDNGTPVKAKIEDNAINVRGCGGYVFVYDKQFGDFDLKCDVKMGKPHCNSGVFVRIGDLKDPVQTGFEAQIISDPNPDVHGFGAIYDLVAPSKNASHRDGGWDSMEIRCDGPKIRVAVNGTLVSSINCDEWTEPGKRPDGTPEQFSQAIKNFPLRGYIGLQDHGDNAWFKNIKIKEIKRK
jgi:hypothetical protein